MKTIASGNRISLVQLNEAFLVPYLKLINDPIITETTQPGEEHTNFSEQKASSWLSGLHSKKDRMDFAILENQQLEAGRHIQAFVGEVVLNDIENKTANIRIALLQEQFDKGYGTEAMKLAISYGFQKMGLMEITLGVFEVNPRGLRVYEKLGFKPVGSEQINGHKQLNMSLKASGFQLS